MVSLTYKIHWLKKYLLKKGNIMEKHRILAPIKNNYEY